jgi:hypothetical protein
MNVEIEINLARMVSEISKEAVLEARNCTQEVLADYTKNEFTTRVRLNMVAYDQD